MGTFEIILLVLFGILVITEIVFGIVNRINKKQDELVSEHITMLTKRVSELTSANSELSSANFQLNRDIKYWIGEAQSYKEELETLKKEIEKV